MGAATAPTLDENLLRMLRLLICFVVLLMAVINFIRTRQQVVRLLTVIAAVGGLLAILALLQDASADGKIYWSVRAPVKATSGPFINYNNFCQFMNLSLGAGVALLLMASGESRESSMDRNAMGLRRWKGQLIALLMLGGLAIVLSTSRGGVISMCAGAAVAAGLLVIRGRSAAAITSMSMRV